MQNGSSFDPHSLSAPRSSPPSLLLPLLLFLVLLAKRTVAGSVSSDDFFFRCPIFQRTVCWLPSSSTTTVPTPGVASRSTIFPLPAKRTLACLTNDVSNAERTSAQAEALAGFQALATIRIFLESRKKTRRWKTYSCSFTGFAILKRAG